jgi:hypothetical protein
MTGPRAAGLGRPVAAAALATALAAGAAGAADVPCPPGGGAGPRVVEIPVDLREVRRYQAELGQGKHTWRGDPRFMAYIEIGSPIDRDVRYEDMRVESETEQEAVVSGRGRRCWYRVALRRFAGGAGTVWTPVRIEYDLAR